jgi:hypothetical protein
LVSSKADQQVMLQQVGALANEIKKVAQEQKAASQ